MCVSYTGCVLVIYIGYILIEKKRGIKSSEKISTCLPPRRRWQVRVFCCIMMFFHGHVDQITPRSLGVFDFHAPVSLSLGVCLYVCRSLLGAYRPNHCIKLWINIYNRHWMHVRMIHRMHSIGDVVLKKWVRRLFGSILQMMDGSLVFWVGRSFSVSRSNHSLLGLDEGGLGWDQFGCAWVG